MTPNSLYRRIYSGWNYRLRNVASGRWAQHCRPTSIIFLLTERCNAKCLHCSIWQNTGREDSPGLEQWKQVVTDIRQWLGPVHITFSGGEALLKPFTVDLVSHASSLGLFLEVLTHGYWEDQCKIERLAKARPSRITISFDGLGETHTLVRGRPRFWERTSRTIETLQRFQKEGHPDFTIRLKNVIMSHNLHDTVEVAKFANQEGMDVFFQAIEQNYNTPDDTEWYLHSENWPKDTAKAIANIEQLIQLKGQGYRIANSLPQLEAMIAYFENPATNRFAIMAHSAHEARRSCAAITNLQLQANGDVTVCTGVPPVGNIKDTGIRQIWERRPRVWQGGCCLEKRCSTDELSRTVPAPSLSTNVDTWNTPSSLSK
jgi:MoaA/NifB/PqqE/SkfB family radical SAM enzyme